MAGRFAHVGGRRGGAGAARRPVRLGCYATDISQLRQLPQLVPIAFPAGAGRGGHLRAGFGGAHRNRTPRSIRWSPRSGQAGLKAAACGSGRAGGSGSLLVEAGARADLPRLRAAHAHQQEAIDQLKAAVQSYLHAGAHQDTARVRAALGGRGSNPVPAYLGTRATATTAPPGRSSSSSTAARAADQRQPARRLLRQAARAAITSPARADGHAPWCARPLARPLPAPLRYQHLLEGVEVLNAFARAEDDRLQ